VAAFGPAAFGSVIVQTVLPPLCTTTGPDGEPVVPDVTVAEMFTEPSLP
jgi:hypothetical protein